MNRLSKAALLVVAIAFFSVAHSAHAQQIKTWMCPASDASAITNTVAAGQVFEILTASLEPDSIIDIHRGKDTLRVGTGGAMLTYPFVIAGPAEIVFRKTATGGQGTIISYRIEPQAK